jgi:uncharacterized protein YegP (UPF0339 family)
MSGKFDLKKTDSGKFMFNLLAGNNQVILTSELYDSKSAAQNGIASVRQNAGDDSRFDRKSSKNGEPYFALIAGNGQQIGRSEMYSGAAAMENGIASVKANAPTAEIIDNT